MAKKTKYGHKKKRRTQKESNVGSEETTPAHFGDSSLQQPQLSPSIQVQNLQFEEDEESPGNHHPDDDHHPRFFGPDPGFLQDDHDPHDHYANPEIEFPDENLPQAVPRSENDSRCSNTAGLIILNSNIDEEENVGSEVRYISVPGLMPESMKRPRIERKTRRERNNFKKPDPTFISAFEPNNSELNDRRCKICFNALNGNLAENGEELFKMSVDPAYRKKKNCIEQNSEKAAIFLGTFRMKYDELIGPANRDEVCVHLAQLWNNRIDAQKDDFLENKKGQGDQLTADEFFSSLENDLKTYGSQRVPSVHDGKSFENLFIKQEKTLDQTEDDVDWSFLPPYIDIDDVIHHFENCGEIVISRILRKDIFQLDHITNFIAKNQIFRKAVVTDLYDSTETSSNMIVDEKNMFLFLTGIKVKKELSSEYRATMREERSSLVFNNLGLLRPIIPNIDSMKTVGLLKHHTLMKAKSESSKAAKYQFRGGDTSGI